MCENGSPNLLPDPKQLTASCYVFTEKGFEKKASYVAITLCCLGLR